jgi:hypothetical protein
MSKKTSWIILFAIVALLCLAGCCCFTKGCHQIAIINQPAGLTVGFDQPASFSVLAIESTSLKTNGLTYKWQHNNTILDGDLYWKDIPEANGTSYNIGKTRLSDLGFYRVLISIEDLKITLSSDPAELHLTSAPRISNDTTVTTVYGTPQKKAATIPSCPGSYYGVVKYINGWLVADTNKACAVNDTNRTDTAVDALGLGTGQEQPPCTNKNCLIFQPKNPKYFFDVYFLKTNLSTGAYPVILSNFKAN